MKNCKRIAALIIISLVTFSNVRAESRPAARNIPDKTLIVGTHLISVDALNTEILKIAGQSAQKTGQDKIYFKSDINKGAWYDITSGGNITRIAVTTDNLVTEETIDALALTHYTKPNGQTVEFSSGKTVSVNYIEGINFPPNLPELEEVAKEAEVLSSVLANLDEDDENRGVYGRAYLSVSWVLALINDSVFAGYTEQLDKLDGFISFLRNEKKAGTAAIELAIAEKMYISTVRELYCYGVVEKKIHAQFDALDYLEFSSLIDKYSSALTNMQAHMLDLIASLKGAPVNSLEKVYLKYSEQMLSNVFSRNYEGAYQNLLKMNALNNLRTEVIEDKALEIEMAREVKKEVMQKLTRELNAGGSDEYRRAARNGERREILEKLKQDTAAQFTLYTDELNAASNYIAIRTDSAVGREKEAAETAEAYSSLLASMPDTDMKEVLSASLSNELEAAAENADMLKLAASEEFNAASADVERLAGEVKNLNEKYLGAVEENDGEADAYKNALGKALAELRAAEAKRDAVEAQVKARGGFVISADIYSGFEGVLEDAEALGAMLSEHIALTGGEEGEALSEIIDKINGLGDGGLNAEASAQEALDALDSLINSIRQRDFDGQARALTNAVDRTAAKIDGNGKLRSDTAVQSLIGGLGDIGRDTKGLLNVSITTENSNKLEELKKAFEVLSDKLSDAAGDALKEPVVLPPETEAEIASLAEEGNTESQNPIITGHLDGYSNKERSDASLAMKKASSALDAVSTQAQNNNVIEPWRLIFTDYNVKLLSPVIYFGNEPYVPSEELAKQMGASVILEKAAGRVVIKDRGVLLEVKANDKYIYINDRRETVSPGALSVSGKTYIPLSCFEKAYRLARAETDGYIIVSKK